MTTQPALWSTVGPWFTIQYRIRPLQLTGAGYTAREGKWYGNTDYIRARKGGLSFVQGRFLDMIHVRMNVTALNTTIHL